MAGSDGDGGSLWFRVVVTVAACPSCQCYAGVHCTVKGCDWLKCEKGHLTRRPKPKEEGVEDA